MHNNKFFHHFIRICNRFVLFLPALFWLLVIYGFDDPCIAGITVISAILHECGHISYLLLSGSGKANIRGDLSGFRIKKKAGASYLSDIRLFAAGPIANLSAALFALPALPFGKYAGLWAVINIATALTNLLPIHGYDGYGILSSTIHMTNNEVFLFIILDRVSFTFTAFLTLTALYILVRVGASYWMAGIFIISLIKEVSRRLKSIF